MGPEYYIIIKDKDLEISFRDILAICIEEE